MKLIETKTLGTAAASIEFTSIPQDFTDLVLLASTRNTGESTFYLVSFNSLTTNFSYRYLQGFGSGVDNGAASVRPFVSMPKNSFTANTFSNDLVYVPNYTASTNKSISIDSVAENNATEGYQTFVAGLWSNTSAITSLQLNTGANNFAIGSTFSLYGITKGSDGIVTTS
jgi:hypothetical protein